MFVFCFFISSAPVLTRVPDIRGPAVAAYSSVPFGSTQRSVIDAPAVFNSPPSTCGTQSAITSTPVERMRDTQFVTCSGELLSQADVDHRISIDEVVGRGDFVTDSEFDKTMEEVLALSLLETSGDVGMGPVADRSLHDARPSVSVGPVQRGTCFG